MIELVALAGAAATWLGLPDRPVDALPASALCAQVEDAARQDRWTEEILRGNVPDRLRQWMELGYRADDALGATHQVTLRVTGDYLAVGADRDFVRVPLDRTHANRVASALGAWLPTPLVVDRIYQEASVKLQPTPLPPADAMTGDGYLLWHRASVGWVEPDVIAAGHKKDVVLSRRLAGRPDRLAIYGWHLAEGVVIQPVSLFHCASYADYSHGVRLVSRVVAIDGVLRDAFDVLADPVLWPLLSDEGAIPEAALILST